MDKEIVKEMKRQIKEYIKSFSNGQYAEGLKVTSIGSKYVHIINAWGKETKHKVLISEFYKFNVKKNTCDISCKYFDICKLSESKRIVCRVDVKKDNLIFGYTHNEIAKKQGIKTLKK